MEQTVRTRAVIFDMDGTLVDSNAVVEAIWTHFAERFSPMTHCGDIKITGALQRLVT